MQVFSKNVNKGNSKLIEYICKKDAKLALSVIQSMKTNDRNSVPLLVWILIRDINAIKYLKEGKSIKSLRIRENQVQWYKKISSRLTLKTIENHIKTNENLQATASAADLSGIAALFSQESVP